MTDETIKNNFWMCGTKVESEKLEDLVFLQQLPKTTVVTALPLPNRKKNEHSEKNFVAKRHVLAILVCNNKYVYECFLPVWIFEGNHYVCTQLSPKALARASPAMVSSCLENDSIIFILLLNQHGKISTSSHKKGLNLIPTRAAKKWILFFPSSSSWFLFWTKMKELECNEKLKWDHEFFLLQYTQGREEQQK